MKELESTADAKSLLYLVFSSHSVDVNNTVSHHMPIDTCVFRGQWKEHLSPFSSDESNTCFQPRGFTW